MILDRYAIVKLWSFRFAVRNSHHIASKSSTSGFPMICGISHLVTSDSKSIQKLNLSYWSPGASPNPKFPPSSNVLGLFGKSGSRSSRNVLGVRYFWSHKIGNDYRIFAKNFAVNPGLAVKNTLARYREAIRLQIEAFWKRNYLVVVSVSGVMACIFLWRFLFGVANAFFGFSEGVAEYGFLALSSAMVAITGLFLRAKHNIDPDKVYLMAMRKLNTSAGILEVMGAPLAGTDLRAYVISGEGVNLKKLRPRFRSKRCFLVFPIRGSERNGLVSFQVKKKNGQYDMKLLAVDIQMASGPDQRLFLIGDRQEFGIGGGLMSALRNPVMKALAKADEFEAEDEREDEEDAARELEEVERRHRDEVEKLEKGTG
ncbi:uncharacterized protein LOC127244988 [Andrographis paniculata]|uniref:uncharacterized protein LOC127244988 n=1 Tax=Andrographis paniculata TaxID=175694 RepID=UPI0021E8B34C|nr:uncharacterized protein LOC127244988 [Andrographis paniculata]